MNRRDVLKMIAAAGGAPLFRLPAPILRPTDQTYDAVSLQLSSTPPSGAPYIPFSNGIISGENLYLIAGEDSGGGNAGGTLLYEVGHSSTWTNDDTDYTIATFTLPGGTLGNDGVMMFEAFLRVFALSGGSQLKTHLDFGSTTLFTTTTNLGAAGNDVNAIKIEGVLWNHGSTSQQKGALYRHWSSYTDPDDISGLALGDSATEDTTGDLDVTLYFRHSNTPVNVNAAYARFWLIK